MTINNKILGVAGMIGAPFLAIEMLTSKVAASNGPQVTTGWAAIFDIIYMAGWMCSIYALLRAGAADEEKWTRNVLKTQLIMLTIANIYNVWSATGIATDIPFFRILDMIWPVSNAFMLVTGIAIIRANVITGWKKYSPLIVGLWLPSAMVPMMILGRVPFTLYWGLAYSVIAWALMAFAAYKTGVKAVVYDQRGYPKLAVVD